MCLLPLLFIVATKSFECKNPKAKLSHTKKEGGIGLVNIKRRLDLLFGKNYSLNLTDENEEYMVKMKFSV